MRKQTQVLIIGAGPSGMVAAAYLQKQGVKCLVAEKAQFPRFSIGESLIPRCMDNFEEVGLLEVLKTQQFQKKDGARFIKGELIGEFDFSKKISEGWDWTWQVPRADFDLVLAKEIQSRGVEIFFEAEVKNVKFQGKTSKTIVQKSGKTIEIDANFIIDASGNGRVLAKQLGLNKTPKLTGNSSVFTHIKEKNRPSGKEGSLITFEVLNDKVWFWYIPFSNGNSSLGFVGPTGWINSFNGTTTEAFQQHLKSLDFYKDRFDTYPFLFEPVKMENIAKNVSRLYGPGFALTGNGAEFLDPVFSSGVAFATESGLLAAKLAVKELRNKSVDWEEEYAEYIRKGVSVFSSYVKEWYTGNLQKLFFSSHQNEIIKQQICSVLAGYVWDESNPFVKQHDRIIKNVARIIAIEEERK